MNTIRHAYKARAAKYHPDGTSPNVEKFLQVQQAYEKLVAEART
jgi:DnaJ-class molecular chaperone